jgi:hypothetical protein
MKIEKIELLFQFSLVIQVYCTVLISMKYSRLLLVAGSTGLLRKHLVAVERDFDLCDAKAKVNLSDSLRRKHAMPITAILKDLHVHRKMVIRMVQVQHTQINKYWKSIKDARKTVKRGAPASLEAVTVETMVQMTLRVIQDLKDLIPELIQPLIGRIYANLRKLQDRMAVFSNLQSIASDSLTET